MKTYTRNCPKCGKLLTYKTYRNWWISNNKNSSCRKCSYKERSENPVWRANQKAAFKLRCYKGEKNPFYGKIHTKESRAKMGKGDKSYWKEPEFRRRASEAKLGEKNANYGVSNYERWVKKYGKEKADELDAAYRAKQSELNKGSRNNMYGKPIPQGSGNGWSGWYKDWYFRSLHELSYMINYIEKNNLKWRSAEAKELQIEYLFFDGTKRTYKADFLIEEKFLIEVKPEKLKNSRLVKLKKEAAEVFCKSKGYEYKIDNVGKISNEQFLTLYNNGKIKFIPRYETLFKEKFLNVNK